MWNANRAAPAVRKILRGGDRPGRRRRPHCGHEEQPRTRLSARGAILAATTEPEPEPKATPNIPENIPAPEPAPPMTIPGSFGDRWQAVPK